MASPTRADELIDLVRKSRVLDDTRLDEYLRRSNGLPSGAPELAKALVRDALLTPFQAEQLLAGKYRGFELGKYKILERIGAGGMGQVYLAEHAMMRRRVAVKVLPTSQSNSTEARDRFLREARAAGALAHPNIVRAYDVDQHQGIYFLVMEYVDGRSLQEIVARFGPLSVERAAYYLWQAAVGLQHAHEAGLVHRDIKPANLLLDRDGIIKMLDLGLARFFDEADDRLTQTGGGKGVLGTADYLAPEQAIDSHEVDIRADIYSLGTTAYFLLTGKPPFGDGTTTQKLLAHQLKEPTPIEQLRPEVPPELAAVLRKMMRKDPAQRYQTPAELVGALDPWADKPLPPPPPYEMPRLCPALQAGTPGSNTSSVKLNKQMLTGLRSNVANSAASLTGPMTDVPNPEFGLPIPPAPAAPPKSKYRYLVLAGVALASAVTIAFAWEFLIVASAPELRAARLNELAAEKEPGDTAKAKPAAAKVVPAARANDLVVGSGASGVNRFPDLQSALAKARSGDRIIVRSLSLAEPLILDRNQLAGRNLSILADSPTGKPVVWQLPSGHPADEPFIVLRQTQDVTIRGFEFDGLGKAAHLAAFVGECPGSAILDCTFRSFTRAAVEFRDAAGQPDRPIKLAHSRVTAPMPEADALVRIVSGENRTARHFDIVDNRLDGQAQAGLAVVGAADGLKIQGNRIHKALSGIRIDPVQPSRKLQATIRQNVIAETKSAIDFAAMPEPGSSFTVQKNLFYRCGELIRIPSAPSYQPSTMAFWIWSSDAPEPLTSAPPGKRYFRKEFDAGDETASNVTLEMATDDECTAWLNGRLIGKYRYAVDSPRVPYFPIAALLRPGRNVLAVEVTNPARPGLSNPGLLVVRVMTSNDSQGKSLAIRSDQSWKWSAQPPADWTSVDFDDRSWSGVRLLTPYSKYARGLIWEQEFAKHGAVLQKMFPNAAGNVRCHEPTPYSPYLGVVQFCRQTLPNDPDDDANFLRYSATHDLAVSYGSPGLPPKNN